MGERERVRELQREAEYERVSDHLEYLGNPFDQMDLSTKKQHALYLYYEILKVLYMILESEANTSLAAEGGLAQHLQSRTACKIQNGRQGAPKWLMGFRIFFAIMTKCNAI